MKPVIHVSFGKCPSIVDEEIGYYRYLYGDRGCKVLVHPVMNQQRKSTQIDEYPREPHNAKFYENLAVLKPYPPCIDHELQDVGYADFRLASCPVDELDGDLPDNGIP